MTKTYFITRGRMLRIRDGAESLLCVHRGALWVTQEGDPRDYYLPAGSSLRLSSNGLAIAQATRPSSVSLSVAEPVKAARERSFRSSLSAPQALSL